ncbi:hypothetical protein [Nocardiopsis sp. HUAS JQ3]|uniref:hypothetical protein n=1 Tax=Nocardiopsis sp. HUAS JQ3 TaxID=3061629 RepID=UPI0023A92F0B|nr:hypothetical protein [Nocardiopsis sp. HUAS JQ3]WDZ92839.1 hypothetical protein PV789_10050 [Nocardiopsis sp. HUAS JQ3]
MPVLTIEIFATAPDTDPSDATVCGIADLFTLALADTDNDTGAVYLLSFDVVPASPVMVTALCVATDADTARNAVAERLAGALTDTGWSLHAGHTHIHHADN